MSLKEKYADTRPIGFCAFNAFHGVLVLDIEYGIDDYVVACYGNDGKRESIRRHKICISESGRMYFKKDGRRYYLDDMPSGRAHNIIMRSDIGR